jgi:hypothetical protein
MRDVESFDGLEFAELRVDARFGELDSKVERCTVVEREERVGTAADGILSVLEAELGMALRWLDGVTVHLSFYEGAPLFLCDPRQRAKLVRYVVERARHFREGAVLDAFVDWRDDPALIAAQSLRLQRSAGSRLLIDGGNDGAALAR